MERSDLLSGAGAVAVGLGVWLKTMASAPRYSFGNDQDLGDPAFWWVLLGAALIGGFLVPRLAGAMGLLLGLPAFVLAPWTAPRGDNDGLWVLVIPYLGVFMLLLAMTAGCGAWIRQRSTRQ